MNVNESEFIGDFNLNYTKDLLLSALELETHVLATPFENLEMIDNGIMKVLWDDFDYSNNLYIDVLTEAKDNYIYYFRNRLEQNFIFMKMPGKTQEVFIWGPFLIEEPSPAFHERIIVKNKIPSTAIQALKSYFPNMPVIGEQIIRRTAETVARALFENYSSENVEYITYDSQFIIQALPASTLNFSMQILEERYKIENKLLAAVSRGDVEMALKHFMEFPAKTIPLRVENPVRNIKNTLFVLNTLYRKAAESGDVHPVYLDQISSDFAVQIERINDFTKLDNLAITMTRKYCLLVKNHSLSKYSPVIRKSINYINLNISDSLSLNILAENFDVNASYLSSQFRKETGATLTEFIHQARIHAALPLLNMREMSIQEVASSVGIDDFCYFSKLFKKQIGISPLQYRSMIQNPEPFIPNNSLATHQD